MDQFTIEVGFTNTRPIIPDEHISWVMVEADSEIEAHLIAAQMAGCHSEMPTSTKTLEIRV